MKSSLQCNTAEVYGMKTTEVTAIVRQKFNSYLLNVSLNVQETSDHRQDKSGDTLVNSLEVPNLHSF